MYRIFECVCVRGRGNERTPCTHRRTTTRRKHFFLFSVSINNSHREILMHTTSECCNFTWNPFGAVFHKPHITQWICRVLLFRTPKVKHFRQTNFGCLPQPAFPNPRITNAFQRLLNRRIKQPCSHLNISIWIR